MNIFYPKSARRALAKLYRPYNPISVFVEDRNISNVYTNLINRALEGIGEIHTVIPLGDRDEVLAAAKSDDDPNNFYIVDGDLNVVYRGIRNPKYNTYVLRCYCIENVIIFGADLPDIMRDYCLIEDHRTLALRLNLSEWEGQIAKWLVKLFIVYAIAHFEKVGVPTVTFSVMRLVADQRPYLLDPQKLRKRYGALLKELYAKIGHPRFLAERRRIATHLRQRNFDWKQIVSGKDYLLPLLHKRCELLCSFKGPSRVLLARLSRHTDFSAEPNFRRAIRQYARAALGSRS